MHKDNTIKTNITYKEYFDELTKNVSKITLETLHSDIWNSDLSKKTLCTKTYVKLLFPNPLPNFYIILLKIFLF